METSKKSFLKFVFIFAAVFLLCYYGALFLTGLSVPGGNYSSFVDKNFNVANWLRSSLIFGTRVFVSLFNIDTVRSSDFVLSILNANGIRIVYSCLGFGVMRFWAAYIVATAAERKKKIVWFFSGLFIIWLLNVIRLSMVLLAGYKGWKFPFGWDHHTWFNIIAYLFIFTMMYFFEKNIKKN